MVRDQPEDWHIPGLDFPDGEQPMCKNTAIRSMLLQAQFCSQGKEAPRRLKYESNLRAIFKAYIFFHPYTGLDNYFWEKTARRICMYFSPRFVKEVFILYVRARRCHLVDKERSGNAYVPLGQGSNEVVRAIDACLRRGINTSRPATEEVRAKFHKALDICEPARWLWPPSQFPDSDEGSLSIRGRAARSNFPPSGQVLNQSPPFNPPQAPRVTMERVEHERDMATDISPPLASRVSFPSRPVSTGEAASDSESDGSEDPALESPINPLKRAASFSVGTGPSKRRVNGLGPTTMNAPHQQEQEDPDQQDSSPHDTGDSDFATPNEGPGEPQAPECEDDETSSHLEGSTKIMNTVKEPRKKPEQGLELGQELEKKPEPETALESERIAEIADQLKAIENLVNQGFVGIEAHVKAIQDRIAQTTAPPASQPPPRKLAPPPPPYLDEYLRGRDHEVLVKGVGNEIYRLKKDLLCGLEDHKHDRTSNVWKKMEAIWLALDAAEQLASGL